jgi:hypothetical protein
MGTRDTTASLLSTMADRLYSDMAETAGGKVIDDGEVTYALKKDSCIALVCSWSGLELGARAPATMAAVLLSTGGGN